MKRRRLSLIDQLDLLRGNAKELYAGLCILIGHLKFEARQQPAKPPASGLSESGKRKPAARAKQKEKHD